MYGIFYSLFFVVTMLIVAVLMMISAVSGGTPAVYRGSSGKRQFGGFSGAAEVSCCGSGAC